MEYERFVVSFLWALHVVLEEMEAGIRLLTLGTHSSRTRRLANSHPRQPHRS